MIGSLKTDLVQKLKNQHREMNIDPNNLQKWTDTVQESNEDQEDSFLG